MNAVSSVFSAGLGPWMETPNRENAVKTFATDADHYACAKDWTSMIQSAIRKVDIGKLHFLSRRYKERWGGGGVRRPSNKRRKYYKTISFHETKLIMLHIKDLANRKWDS